MRCNLMEFMHQFDLKQWQICHNSLRMKNNRVRKCIIKCNRVLIYRQSFLATVITSMNS